MSDFHACRRLIHDCAPEIVLHAAAWTDVDGCALDPQRALRVNGLATAHLAALTSGSGIPILYISSNEVFDGALGRPYSEYDRPNPLNPYGYSKWYGERAIAQVNPRHYIVRTALALPRTAAPISYRRFWRPQTPGKRCESSPTKSPIRPYANDLASAIAQLIDSERYGIYHLVNQGAVSRWGFARSILDCAGCAETSIERISRHEWLRHSLPPEQTALANVAGASIGIRLRPWQDALRAFLEAEGAD